MACKAAPVSRLSALLDGFAPADREVWLTLVDKTLKGRSLDQLATPLGDGVAASPLYIASTGTPRLLARPVPGDGSRPWDVRALIDDADAAGANGNALEALEGGAHSLLLRLDPGGQSGVAIGDSEGLARALDGVLLDVAPVALDAGLMGPLTADWLAVLAKGAPSAALGFNLDPLSAFARSGATPGPVESHVISAAQTGARHQTAYPLATLCLASGSVIHEAGGTVAQELAFMAAAALTYARALNRAGLSLQESWAGIAMGVSLDGDLFTGAAKLRAARAIWARLTQACHVNVPARIEARSSKRMLTRLDAWTNQLRLTGATFAAAIGGADSLVIEPFTSAIGDATPLARRQARNIQLVLMEEAALGRVADPAGGSAYVESLTDAFARAAWRRFQDIETAGGLIAALEVGAIAQAVQQTARETEAQVRARKLALVGVSQFADPNEAAATTGVRHAQPAPARTPPLRLPGPDSRCLALTPIRWSEAFERVRAAASSLAPAPSVIIAALGSPREFAARADFVRNLIAIAGLHAQTCDVSAFACLGGEVVVICGSDEAYGQEAITAVNRLKAAGAERLWLAGRPGPLEPDLRAAGVEGFLFQGMDVVAGLETMLKLRRGAA